MTEGNKKEKKDSIKKQVNAIYNLMKSENLEEMEIKEDDFYLYLRRKSKSGSPAGCAPAMAPVPAAASSAADESAPPQANGKSNSVAKQPEALKGETIKSPIIGTFYRSPSPTAPPFSSEGDTVNANTTLCIVEAMKVMNEIKSDQRVKILKILVENGKPVTSGQDLFLIEKG